MKYIHITNLIEVHGYRDIYMEHETRFPEIYLKNKSYKFEISVLEDTCYTLFNNNVEDRLYWSM